MYYKIKNLMTARLVFLLLAATIAVGFSGCKSQKKIAREKAVAERLAQIEQAKKDLLMIINDQGQMTQAQQEQKIAEIKSLALDDNEVDALIIEAEKAIERKKELLRQKEEERLQKERETAEAKKQEQQKFSKIEDYFDAIASASELQTADRMISDALGFFASPDVPVLTIIYMDSDIRDYDKPTTIRRYLEYLKDQKKNPNKVYNIQYDANGKIIELELIKL